MENTVQIYENTAQGGGNGGCIFVFSGAVKLLLDSASKDKDNDASSGKLCYIQDSSSSPYTTILSGSNINGNSWPSDETISSPYIEN